MRRVLGLHRSTWRRRKAIARCSPRSCRWLPASIARVPRARRPSCTPVRTGIPLHAPCSSGRVQTLQAVPRKARRCFTWRRASAMPSSLRAWRPGAQTFLCKTATAGRRSMRPHTGALRLWRPSAVHGQTCTCARRTGRPRSTWRSRATSKPGPARCSSGGARTRSLAMLTGRHRCTWPRAVATQRPAECSWSAARRQLPWTARGARRSTSRGTRL
mmetsp:Transcript_98774/g.318571  ORF Transcript_98774/g.318571 Transcript_98774/m.318571 type:complete len:216 (-) Transcript_98774:105-752(-)